MSAEFESESGLNLGSTTYQLYKLGKFLNFTVPQFPQAPFSSSLELFRGERETEAKREREGNYIENT